MTLPPMNLRSKGKEYENVALNYLERNGLALVDRNYRTTRGEIDLVMRENETLVFVEVRYRARSRFGGGLESIDLHKRRKLVAAARHFLQKTRLDRRMNCRFDVISCDDQTPAQITWVPRAFTADEV